MQERRLRLGDVLDDYCPRERRITNHAVVAMIENRVKQTRCTTCDAEHPYRAAQLPVRRRKREEPAALFQEVLAGAPKVAADLPPGGDEAGAAVQQAVGDPSASTGSATAPEAATVPAPQASVPDEDDGPVHRPLIRATLPRPERQTPVRPVPEFTIRQLAGRGESRGHPRGARHPTDGRPHGSGAGGRAHYPGSRGTDRPPLHARSPRGGPSHRPGKKRSR